MFIMSTTPNVLLIFRNNFKFLFRREHDRFVTVSVKTFWSPLGCYSPDVTCPSKATGHALTIWTFISTSKYHVLLSRRQIIKKKKKTNEFSSKRKYFPNNDYEYDLLEIG